MEPMQPEPEFTEYHKLDKNTKEVMSQRIASEQDMDAIRSRLFDTKRRLDLIPFTKDFLDSDNYERGVSNLLAQQEIETRALRIKAGF